MLKQWVGLTVKVLVLLALTREAQGERTQARQLLNHALTMARPGGFIRLFVDEGASMAVLLADAAARGTMPDYVGRLLSAFRAETITGGAAQAGTGSAPASGRSQPPQHPADADYEPLSPRELEILRLVALGLSNREIAERLLSWRWRPLKVTIGSSLRSSGFSAARAVARGHALGLI